MKFLCLALLLSGCSLVELYPPRLDTSMIDVVLNPQTVQFHNVNFEPDNLFVTIYGDNLHLAVKGGIYVYVAPHTIKVPRKHLVDADQLYNLAAQGLLPQIYSSYLLSSRTNSNLALMPVLLTGEILLCVKSIISFNEFVENNNLGISIASQRPSNIGQVVLTLRLSGSSKYANLFSFVELLKQQPWVIMASPVFMEQ